MRQAVRRPVLPLLSCAILGIGLAAPAGSAARSARGGEAPTAGTPAEETSASEAPRARRKRANATREASAAAETRAPEERTAAPREREARGHFVGANCQVSVEASSPQVSSGEAVTLLGKLTCPAGVSAAREPISISQHQSGSGALAMADLGAISTEEDGSFHFTTNVQANSVFVVRTPQAHAARVVVKVVPLITLTGHALAAQSAARHPWSAVRARFSFSGTVSPFSEGTLVTLQREYAASGEKWHAIAFGRIGAGGSFSFVHGFRTPGMVSVRVVTRIKGAVKAASQPLTYDIAQGQNPRLTIEASGDPVAAAQQLTISGVAGESHELPVTLLGRTPGHPFAVLAKGATDAHGIYSFTVHPTQNTTYRVIDASTASTPLFEGVRYALTVAAPPTSTTLQTPLTFTGTVAAAHLGQEVLLERGSASGFDFHVIGVGTVDESSAFSITHSFAAIGTYTLRIRVPASADTLDSTSAQFSVAVTPPTATPEPEQSTSAP